MCPNRSSLNKGRELVRCKLSPVAARCVVAERQEQLRGLIGGESTIGGRHRHAAAVVPLSDNTRVKSSTPHPISGLPCTDRDLERKGHVT